VELTEGLPPPKSAEGCAQQQLDPGLPPSEPQGARDPRPPSADVDGSTLQTETPGPPAGEQAAHSADSSRIEKATPAHHPLAAEKVVFTPAPPCEEQVPVPTLNAAEQFDLVPAPPLVEEAILVPDPAAAEPTDLTFVPPCDDHAAAEPADSPPSPGTAASIKLAAERAHRKAQEKQARAQERQAIKEMRR
jgi:hypothetical protein